MHPIITHIGPFTIYSYGAMVALAFLCGVFLARAEAARKGLNPESVYDLGFYILIGSLVGGRLYYVSFFDYRIFVDNPVSVLKIWEGGLAIHGAIFGGVLAGILFCRLKKLCFWKFADIAAPSVMLGQAVGRIGCFLNGCCYGVPTESVLGVIFPENSPAHSAYNGLSVHPTQLYEFILDLTAFFVLMFLRKRLKFDGGLFLVYLMLYGCIRLTVSSLRGDSLYLWGTGFKAAHAISAVIIIVSYLLFIHKRENA